MRAVAGDGGAQSLDVLARRLETLGRGRDPDEPSTGLQDLVASGPDIAAHRVEDDIAIGNRPREIFGVVVDRPVGAELLHISKVRGARRGENLGADMLGELDRKPRDAAGAALDEDRLAGFEMRRVLERP